MSVSDRLKKLEQRPQSQRPHGMTQEALDVYVKSLPSREQDTFLRTMTDDDLEASINYLLTEQHHASP